MSTLTNSNSSLLITLSYFLACLKRNMTNRIDNLSIKRINNLGSWSLRIKYNSDGIWYLNASSSYSSRNEDKGLSSVLESYVNNTGLQQLRGDIVEGFNQLRQSNQDVIELKIYLPTHMSCGKNQKDSSTVLAENEISQFDLKQKLASLDKNAEAMKFYDNNKCSVCLSDYKEIVDEDLHIVVPRCRITLCCKCADEISGSEKKECPSCGGNITTDSFELLKFNSDLEVVLEDWRIFFEG